MYKIPKNSEGKGLEPLSLTLEDNILPLNYPADENIRLNIFIKVFIKNYTKTSPEKKWFI